jgi:hypothetical protein
MKSRVYHFFAQGFPIGVGFQVLNVCPYSQTYTRKGSAFSPSSWQAQATKVVLLWLQAIPEVEKIGFYAHLGKG